MYVSSFPFFILSGIPSGSTFPFHSGCTLLKLCQAISLTAQILMSLNSFSFYTFWILLLHNRKITRTLMQPPQYRTVLSDTKRTLYHGISVDKNHIKLLHPILFSIAKATAVLLQTATVIPSFTVSRINFSFPSGTANTT